METTRTMVIVKSKHDVFALAPGEDILIPLETWCKYLVGGPKTYNLGWEQYATLEEAKKGLEKMWERAKNDRFYSPSRSLVLLNDKGQEGIQIWGRDEIEWEDPSPAIAWVTDDPSLLLDLTYDDDDYGCDI